MNLNQEFRKWRSIPAMLVLAFFLLLVLAVVACEGGARRGQQPDPGPTQAGNFTHLSGSITVDGSSTVFPITESVAEEFGKLTRGEVRITVGISGTGGGFNKFCNGETDLNNASRPIVASEVELCARNGIEYIELPVVFDGLTVVVNPKNKFVRCMTVAELRTVWAPEAEGKITHWNQVRPEWPNKRIQLYGPGLASGTFDYFTEVVNGKAKASRGDFASSENDNVLLQGVSGDANSLGYFGYAYYAENSHLVKAVAIDGGRGCVTPTVESTNDGTYTPLTRPLFLYVRQDSATQPQVREFVRYYLGEGGQEWVVQAGYLPFTARVYELVLNRFNKGATGTLFGGSSAQRGSLEAVLSANP